MWSDTISDHVSAGGTTVVEGAVGTGKTSALDGVAELWESRGHRVVRARGSELDRDLPFGVVAQLFEPALDSDVAVPPEAMGALHMTATGADFTVLHAVYRLAVLLAGGDGLLLVVDDVHWADAASLRWLAYLAVRMRRQPISLLLSVGVDERCDDPSFGEVVDSGRRVRLGELTAHQAETLAAKVYGGVVDPVFVAACLTATGGNPQLTARLLETLHGDDVPPKQAAAWRVAEYGEFVRGEVVLARLRRRPPAVVTVAQCVAVLGPDPHPAALAELTGLDPADLGDALRTLNGIGVAGALSTVLDDMPARVRDDLRLRAARALRDNGASPREIAAQLLETPPGGEPWAGEVLDMAAKDAASLGQSDAAAKLLWRSLREPLASPSRALRMLGVAELIGDQPGALERLREAYASSSDTASRAQAAIPLAMALHAAGQPDELVSVLSSCADDPQVREHRLMHAFGFASAVPSRVVPEDGPVNVLYRAATGELDAAAAGALTMQLLDSSTDPVGCIAGATTLSLADREDDAITLLDRVIAREQMPVLRGFAFLLRANAHRRKGDLTTGRADAGVVSTLLERDTRWPTMNAMHIALRVDLLMEDNRADEADALLESACTDEVRATWSMAGLLTARGRVNLVRGDARTALEHFLAARDHAAKWPFRNPALLPWRAGAALACAALGDGERARRLADEEIAHVRAWGAPRALGMTLRAAGRVNTGAAGRALLESAVVVLRATTARLELARALTDLGVVLRRQGDTSSARAHLKDALDLAQKCGSGTLSARAYAELVATGSGPRKLRQTGPTALTPTEHQVANLAARGRSNEEIATTLLVPTHAVEGLLSGAFRKLGVSGRLQLHEVLDVAD